MTNQSQTDRRGAIIQTDVEVREGQKVVVGKANLGGSEGQESKQGERAALIVVITAGLVS